ncbi:MAG: hypothetical protein M0Z41_06935 [Peptococcaceae bacterium]|nr:hypothetical protein [Peptococcaceae bacterium]
MRKSFERLAVVAVLILAVGWAGWQVLVARTGPAVRLLPSMVGSRLAAHGGVYVSLAQVTPTLVNAVVANDSL